MQVINKPQELFEVGTDIEQHNVAVMVENLSDEFKKRAILKRGELYKNFNGTQRECSEHFGVSQPTITNYTLIYDNGNLVITADNQEISKNKLLKIIRDKKAEEEELEDFEITRENLHDGETYKSQKKEAIADEVVDLARWESPKVKNRLTSKMVGIENKKIILESGKSDDEKAYMLLSKKNMNEVMNGEEEVGSTKPTKEQKADANKILSDRNKKLEKENKILKEENKRLLKEVARIDYLKEMEFYKGNLSRLVNGIRKERELSEEAFNNMRPEIENALRILRLPTVSISSFDEIKKAYRDEAKAVHPDFDGDSEAFRLVNESYKLLKGVLNGK